MYAEYVSPSMQKLCKAVMRIPSPLCLDQLLHVYVRAFLIVSLRMPVMELILMLLISV